jgi:signal transduction histidine kinase
MRETSNRPAHRPRVPHSSWSGPHTASALRIGIAGHDLRNPLGIIKLSSDMLLDETAGPTNNEQSEFLGWIKNASSSMLALVNDLLDVVKIEAGKLDLRLEQVDLEVLLRENFLLNQLVAGKKGIELNLDIHGYSSACPNHGA